MVTSFAIVLVFFVILAHVQGGEYEDTAGLTRESVKAQIESIEHFIEMKHGTVHPSKLQSYWLQLGMLYQVSKLSKVAKLSN